jgi:serine/threonine protein kinase
MTRELDEATDLDDRINEVLLAYVESYESGRPLDQAELLAANPKLHDGLKEFFAAHEKMESLAVGLRTVCHQAAEPQYLKHNQKSELGQLGDFRLLREIGRGGMGVVYEAEQVSLQRRVALKLLPFAAALDPRQLQRFKNEALAAAHLRHENIVPVHAVGEDRGVHYYAMQFVEGRSLAALISEMKLNVTEASRTAPVDNPPSPLDVTCPAAILSAQRGSGNRKYFDWVASLGCQAALALEYAHSVGIVHRDIKPANLLLDPRGQLWVTDFGLAQIAGDTGLTISGEMLGTLRYASPEQVLGRRGVVDQRSDIYSLGATIYELLTMSPLFDGHDRNELLRQIAQDEPRPPRSVHSWVPRELETIVLKSICKEPSERYRSAREFAEDLQRFRENRPILARRPGPAEHLRKLARRHPSLIAASIVVLALLTAGSLLSTFLIRSEQQRTKTEQKNVQEAYRRERQRAEEADARFLLARRSVDEMFRICQEELADRPGLEALRKRLLWSVLVYYQEFLEERRDDPKDRAELVDAKQRVEKILAELAMLRAASQLYLLRQDAVLDDLKLSEVQRPQIEKFCQQVGKDWIESFAEVGRVSPKERGLRAIERAKGYEAEINVLLTASQRNRLRQIGLQAEGLSAFGQPEVVTELKLSEEQREQIRMIEEQTLIRWMRISRSSRESADPLDTLPSERVLGMLNEKQIRHWKSMTGEALNPAITAFPRQQLPFGGSIPKSAPQ